MILFIILSLFLGITQAADQAAGWDKDIRKCEDISLSWKKDESTNCVGYPVEAKFFCDFTSYVRHSRMSIFSPGLFNKKQKQSTRSSSLSETFGRFDKKWLPGAFFIFEPEYSGKGHFDFSKSLSFGQHKDAFAFIYVLNKLYNQEIKEFTLHAQCYGTRRVQEALYYLSDNEQTKKVEDFFLALGSEQVAIDKIRRRELLKAIQCILFQTPLKKPSDGPVAIGHNMMLPIVVMSMHFGLNFLNNQEKKSYINLAGIGIFTLPIIFSTINHYFKLDHYIIKNHFMPYVYSYDNNALSEDEIISRLQYLVKDNPHWAFFMTTAKDDRVVGNWDVAEFFESFPVAPDRKYLVPSPHFGHRKVTQQQILAKNAFLRRYGSSYYNFPKEELTQGEKTLNFAQEGQSSNIKEYIQYMESDDNEF